MNKLKASGVHINFTCLFVFLVFCGGYIFNLDSYALISYKRIEIIYNYWHSICFKHLTGSLGLCYSSQYMCARFWNKYLQLTKQLSNCITSMKKVLIIRTISKVFPKANSYLLKFLMNPKYWTDVYCLTLQYIYKIYNLLFIFSVKEVCLYFFLF